MEKYFIIKEINATYTKKQDLLRQQKHFFTLTLTVKIRKCLWICPKTWELSEGILSLRAFFTLSMILADLHPDKTMLFPFWSASRIWGENNGN